MTRAVGPDISVYDNSFIPTSLVKFVIMRVSYGTQENGTYMDRNFTKYYPYSLRCDIRGGYHYMSSGGTWQEQAEKYLSFIDGKDLQFNVCDIESAYNLLSKNYIEMSMKWMEYVQRMTGKRSVVYSNVSTFKDFVYPYAGEELKNYSKWIAQYNYRYSDFQTASPLTPPNMGNDWQLWQFIPGEWGQFGYDYGVGRAGVDLNVFNGTEYEMYEWAKVTPPQVSPSQPPPVEIPTGEYKVIVPMLNIRSMPNVQSARKGQLTKGTVFKLYSVELDNKSNSWGKIGESKYVSLQYNNRYMTTWHGEAVPQTPSPVETPSGEYMIVVSVLNIRSKANIQSASIGRLTRGTKVLLYNIELDGANNIWGKIGEDKYIALKYKGKYMTTWKV